jgi:hypothetical protein
VAGRRGLVGPAVAGAVVLSTASPAGGWAKGREGCNSFGSHDWILKKAIRAVGSRPSWVRFRVALLGTDDPDCKDGVDHASGTWWHVYERWGDEWGGADEATRIWFRRSKRCLEAGRERAGSRALGILSHFIADVANPMHTDQSNKEEDIHSRYEDDVDERVPYLSATTVGTRQGLARGRGEWRP